MSFFGERAPAAFALLRVGTGVTGAPVPSSVVVSVVGASAAFSDWNAA
jgi:hypothetical protein